MISYSKMSKDELKKELEILNEEYSDLCKKGYDLSMARGKPGPDQLDISDGLLNILSHEDIKKAVDSGEFDPRNYGGLMGLNSAKRLLASVVGRKESDIILFGNASLNIMFDTISRAFTKGIMGNTPWGKLDKVKFLCPAPGYDRHFAICEHFGIEMINIDIDENGPDMEKIEELVSTDESVKGIWCVPKFSNPQGFVYSDECVKRFAALKPKAKDFRLFWDNAYCIHYLYEPIEILDIIDECKKAGNEDMVFEFLSLSKVTYAGGSISGVITSKNNIEDIKNTMTIQTIGHDKVNQLRHVKFFESVRSVEEQMKMHADILRPKFEAVSKALKDELISRGLGSFYEPKGGYFITYKAMEGCAKRIVELAKNAGMEMTGAGACFPYGKDPENAYIRIAPSFPSLDEMKEAAYLFTVCARIASIEKIIG